MQRKILIVDDSELNLTLLSKILSGEYTVITATNGNEALSVLSESHDTLSAVLLDLLMPVMNGFEVLEHMNADTELAHIPVIVMTGSTDSDSEKRALALGAHDYITKPYDADIIKRRLSNIIKLRENAAMVNELRRDRLTGLLTRENFFEQASALISAHEAGYYVMASFDINRFKVVNDQYGTDVGDRVLKLIADTFQKGFERVGGLVGRIMADHFAVLYPADFIDSKEIEDIRDAASVLDGSISPISYNIGRYIVDDLSLTASAMYDRASLAEQSVKGRFDNNIGVYSEVMRQAILQEQTIVGEMKQALSGRQFEVWYQPQYNHATGALIGSEALVRWRHPDKGLISPGVFIPIFERNGFVYELDKFVWEQACIFLRRRTDEGGIVLPVSVNISRYDIFREDLIPTIVSLTRKYDIPPSLLRLEITESAFAESTDQIIKVVSELIALDYTLEIDDFGSGYSSLNTLKDVPAQIVKLDMRFLKGDGDNTSGRGGNIIESVVRMVKWLGMSVIAEGVEAPKQADYLRSIGCIYVQGFLYARPMPEDEYDALLDRSDKEHTVVTMNSLEHLDNNAFWNPASMDTLIFNSFAGSACIFELSEDRIEMLRVTEHYLDMLGGDLSAEDILKLDWISHISEHGLSLFRDAVMKSALTKSSVTCEIELLNIPSCIKKIYLRVNMRVIASSEERYLVYCINDNITAQRLSEQETQLISAQLRSMMNDMPGGFIRISVDRDGKIKPVFINDGFLRLTDMSRDKLLADYSESLFTGIHPDDLERVKNTLSLLLEQNQAQSCRYRLKRGDGSYIQLLVLGRISEDTSGGVFVNLYFTDISEQTKYEEYQNTLLDNLPGGAGIYDLINGEFNLVYQNKSYWELVGLNEAAFPDNAPMSAIHHDDVPIIMNALTEAIMNNHDVKCNIRLRHLTKGYRPVRLTGRIVCTGHDSYRIYATFTPDDL